MIRILATRFVENSSKSFLNTGILQRAIHATSATFLKQINITENKEKNLITIEAEYIDSAEKFGKKLLNFNPDEKKADSETAVRPCAFCELEKRDIYVQHTDVLILRQFLKDDGEPLSRKVTGLCKRQQRKLVVIAKHARQAGLTLSLTKTLLDGSKPSPDPRKRYQHQKWNTYFDDYEYMKRNFKYI